jgi:hypothetical protein
MWRKGGDEEDVKEEGGPEGHRELLEQPSCEGVDMKGLAGGVWPSPFSPVQASLARKGGRILDKERGTLSIPSIPGREAWSFSPAYSVLRPTDCNSPGHSGSTLLTGAEPWNQISAATLHLLPSEPALVPLQGRPTLASHVHGSPTGAEVQRVRTRGQSILQHRQGIQNWTAPSISSRLPMRL